MKLSIENEAAICAEILGEGKLILYPTDTIWGIGCDATNEQAVQKIFKLKRRSAAKSMIILLADKKDIPIYAHEPNADILEYVSSMAGPITAVYEHGKNVAPGLLNEDGTIAIRISEDEFCSALLNKFNKPVVSSSANISGMPAPAIFKDIDTAIKNGVDYIVQHRRSDLKVAKPSSIIRLNEEKKLIMIRS